MNTLEIDASGCSPQPLWTDLDAHALRFGMHPAFKPPDDGPMPEIDLGWATYRPARAELCGPVLFAFEPRGSSVEMLGLRAGLADPEVLSVLDELFDWGLVDLLSDVSVPADRFYEHAIRRGRTGASILGLPETRRQVTSRTGHRRLQLGNLVEEFHYVSSVASHVAPAIGAATSLRIQTILSEYLSDEYAHHILVSKGLLAAGLGEDDLEQAVPLPSTLALMNFLRFLAGFQPLAYCLCLGLVEASPDQLDQIESEWQSIFAGKALPDDVYQPFYEHNIFDAKHDHSSVFRSVFAQTGSIDLAARQAVIATVFQYLHAYGLYWNGIYDFYCPEDGPAYFSNDSV